MLNSSALKKRSRYLFNEPVYHLTNNDDFPFKDYFQKGARRASSILDKKEFITLQKPKKLDDGLNDYQFEKGVVEIIGCKASCSSVWCKKCFVNKGGAKRYADRLAELDSESTRQVVLTIDPKKYQFNGQKAFEKLKKKQVIHQFIHNLERTSKIKIIDWVWILEWHTNGFPHWHVFIQTKKGKQGQIGNKTLRKHWKHGLLYESYIKSKHHWKKFTDYFQFNGYFNPNSKYGKDKSHQLTPPDWALSITYSIRKMGSKVKQIVEEKIDPLLIWYIIVKFFNNQKNIVKEKIDPLLIWYAIVRFFNNPKHIKLPEEKTYKEILDSCGQATYCFIKREDRLIQGWKKINIPYKLFTSQYGGKFIERKELFVCPDHQEILGSGKCFIRFGQVINKTFSDTKQANQFLCGLRFKTVEGTFDPKDYLASKPYSFTNLSEKYLRRKQTLKSFKDKKRHIKVAQEYFQDKNVKEINGADIEDYLFSIEAISEKTRHNYKSSLHDFWNWILRRGVINNVHFPIFPVIKYELAYRTITDMKTQESIIEEVHKISHSINPKIWFGIDLLATYVNLRPGDLLKIKEKDIDLNHGVLTIYYPTKSKNKIKTVRLLEHHIKGFKGLKKQFTALPSIDFFRHHGGISSIKPNQPFGAKYFKKWWDKACHKLGIVGLDLYGGTRHTTTTEIARQAGTNNARIASAHETNTAFDRYCQFQDDTAFKWQQLLKGLIKNIIILFNSNHILFDTTNN